MSSAAQKRMMVSIMFISVELQEGCAYEKTKQTHDSPILIDEKGISNGKSVFIKSFGCSHNMSDGEYMGGILQRGGYTIVQDKDRADVWSVRSLSLIHRLINTCTVRDKSIASFENLYREAQQKHIPVVIAGCMTEGLSASSPQP